MATVVIELLGRFSVAVDDVTVPAGSWRGRRAADLVKLLALAPDRRLPKAHLMEELWPGSDTQASGTNLRKALHFARATFGTDAAVVSEAGALVLWPDAEVATDVEHFEASAARASASGDAGECRAAAARYRGGLLPDDLYEEWSVEPRARLRRCYLEVLRAGGLWEDLLEEDPTDEHATRRLMRRHLDSGERREAIRSFERLRSALRDQLGVGPDRNTVALYEEVLAAEGPQPAAVADHVRGLLARGLLALSRGDLDTAERAAEDARALALDEALGRELGEASVILAKVAMAQGRWRERFAEELVESMQLQARMAPIVYDAHLCLAEYFLAAPDGHEAAIAFARRMLAAADEAGSATGGSLALLMLGEALLVAGRTDEAEVHLREAATANERLGCLSGAALARQRLAEAAVVQERLAEARQLLEEAHALAGRSDIAAHLLVRIHGTLVQAAQDPEQALAAVRAAERQLRQVHSCEPCSMGFLTAAVAACARAGELARARAFLADAERISGMWNGGLWSGAVWESRAHLRRAEGDEAQARALLVEAAAAFSRAGDAPGRARCLASAGADAGQRATASPAAAHSGNPSSSR